MLKIKTIIELFDTCQIENVVACIKLKPEKVVFVGYKETMTTSRKTALERFFRMKKLNISIEYEIVGRYDYDSIVERLNNIIKNFVDCCFDLTGGKELVLAAMGEVAVLHNIPMVQFNVRTGDFIRVKNCDKINEPEKSALLIEENVALNGGAVIDANGNGFEWNLTDDFKHDVELIWNICKNNCSLWNKQSVIFGALEKSGTMTENLCVRVNLNSVDNAKTELLNNSLIMKKLAESKLIRNYSLKNDVLTFTYKNEQIRRCILKAGNILELYAYMIACELNEENPGFYDDIKTGVFMDWDGIIHGYGAENQDTRNEVDIMMMKDMIPVFISCKNGEVHKEALYELSAVSEKFGGKYSKKILLTTYMTSDRESRNHLLQRAQDMNITVIYSVEKMNKNEFKKIFLKKSDNMILNSTSE